MSIACPHSRIWLRRTINCCIKTSCRSVSTTSAINRGLRATKEADGGRGQRRDRSPQFRRNDSIRNAFPTFKIKKFTAGGERPGSAEFWATDSVNNIDARSGRKTKERSRILKSPIDANSHATRMHQAMQPYVRNRVPWTEYSGSSRVDLDHASDEIRTSSGRRTGGRDRRARRAATISSHDAQSHLKSERMFIIEPPTTTPSNKQSNGTDDDHMPLSIPYTTAASTFLYGTNTVLASLKANRRKLYKLYLHSRFSDHGAESEMISKLAKKAGVRIQSTSNFKLLDRMSEDRPHNGVVLEASNLPAPPVLSLGKPDSSTDIIPLHLRRQSAEDMVVNGSPKSIPSLALHGREPLIVLLDGITDPGNVGSILRSCYFYGVDAVAVATNTCANLNSAILAKASSGACEAIPILALPKPSGFVYESAKAGWKVFAAVAPPSTPLNSRRPPKTEATKFLTTTTLAMNAPLTKHPCILMLGAEGEGLRKILKNRADYFVTIEGRRKLNHEIDVGVDSLNVSVAASVLLEAFMNRAESVKAAV